MTGMTDVTDWVRNVFLMILAISFVEILIPEGTMAKYLRFIFSVLILAVILSSISVLWSKLV